MYEPPRNLYTILEYGSFQFQPMYVLTAQYKVFIPVGVTCDVSCTVPSRVQNAEWAPCGVLTVHMTDVSDLPERRWHRERCL